MQFTDIFIRRPVLAIVVSCLLLMLGLQAGNQLQLRQFPDVEKSLVVVQTAYPGASARTVQGFVTEPLQRRIAAAEGVDYMTSRSDPGVSRIEVHARLGEDADALMTGIIAKINEARFELQLFFAAEQQQRTARPAALDFNRDAAGLYRRYFSSP